MNFFTRSRLIAPLVTALMIAGIAGCTPSDTTVVLTVAKDGTTKEYTMTQLKKMEAVDGTGGTLSSTGKVSGPSDIKGVGIDAVLEEVGGLEEGEAIRVEAEDGYSMTISQSQIAENDFIVFDAVTKMETSHGDLTLLAIYEQDGEPLAEGSGPLRLGIISDEGTVTEGHWWIKWIVRIDVIDYQEPWTLELIGHSTASIDNEEFNEGAGFSFAEWTDDDNRVWKGIPVKSLLGLIDDDDPSSFNEQLANAGYEVEFKAGDDYSKVFTSAEIMAGTDWIVSHMRDGEEMPENQWPLRFVGSNLSKGQMVGALASIKIIFP